MSGQSGTTQIRHCLSVLILFTFSEILLNGVRNNETSFSPLKKWQINYIIIRKDLIGGILPLCMQSGFREICQIKASMQSPKILFLQYSGIYKCVWRTQRLGCLNTFCRQIRCSECYEIWLLW